jgi:hypothetical protein
MALEHTEPWPGGRGNHYSFDLNRDWIALTQPEIRSQVKALLEWFPLVYVDLHEMGADSTYYFAPEAVPFNPHLASDQVTSLLWFGKNNARWFDKFGFSYFTREVFDAFYPGYGASWPSYFGSVAMTYEQASSRGLLMRRADESVFHFRDTVRHHFVASLSTAETTARNREHLLGDFYQYRQSAIEEGRREPVREYLLPRSGDVSSVDHLALLLAEHGVEVRRAKSAFRAASREFPASSYAISLAQPAKRLIRALLDADVRMEPPFLKEQERRRAKKLSDEIYDVTAWSLPLMFNLECVPSAEPVSGDFEMVRAGEALPGKVDNPNATVAYLVPWGTASAGRFLTAALRQDLRLWSADKAFVQSGRKFPSGTLIIKVKEHGADLAGQLARLALSSGAEVVGTETGWVDEGPDFGSNHVLLIRPPSIALAWDHPTSPLSAGATRFLLERRYQYPVTAVRSSLLSGADLRRFQVLILPDQGSASGYSGVFGAEGAARLKQWVTAGGTLVGFAGAVGFLADPKVALLDVAQENAWRSSEPPKKTEPPELRVPGKLLTSEADYLKSIQADKELPDQVPGVIARARLDRDHWIAAGMGSTVTALIDGRNIFTPIKLDKGVNAALFLGPDKLLASGYLWEENRKQLAYKPLVIVQRQGRGLVVAFTADPTFRAYLDGLDVLLLNAVFRGPAHTSRAPIE